MKQLTYRRWNNRIRNLNLSGNTGLKAKIEGVLPKYLSKAHTRRMVQLLTEHSNLGYFQFLIGRCFSPVCTCLISEETTAHFLFRRLLFTAHVLFIQIYAALNHPRNWRNCWNAVSGRIGNPLIFVELSRGLYKAK